MFRGSDLLSAKSYIKDGELSSEYGEKGRRFIQFVDTMNYGKMSVKNMGKIIGLNKLTTPKFIGHKPKDVSEWIEMIEYNLIDSTVSKKFMDFFQTSIRNFGGDLKLTISSCSLKLFRNKYLNGTFFVHEKEHLQNILKAYYGGRTEVFKRGRVENVYYHDINSMYPFVMSAYKYPNPNTMVFNRKGLIDDIMNLEGVSNIEIFCPENIKIPFLPMKHNQRLIFPTGFIKGWYSFVEIRHALKLGYKLISINETYYYKESIEIFKDFVTDVYTKRQEYKKLNNPMEYVLKIILNSLYGKFAQKFDGMKVIKHKDIVNVHDLDEGFEEIGDFYIINEDREPSNFCFPIWSIYVTSYARIELYNYMILCDPIYVDTDSIICDRALEDSNVLGRLKIEYNIREGLFIRPKMYAFITQDGKEVLKCKGINSDKLNYSSFFGMLDNFSVTQTRFLKFKTAIRKKLLPNLKIDLIKEYDINDNKRVWEKDFDKNEICLSVPINIK
jgi:DNA polymerase elongation subunit (family B)